MASKKKEEVRSESALAAAVARIDRDALAPKTRLYALAKQLGVASKDLVEQFAEMGMKKSAQSSATPEEIGQLIAALAPATHTKAEAADEKIEDKANEEAAAVAAEASAEEKPAKTAPKKRAKRATKRVAKADKTEKAAKETKTAKSKKDKSKKDKSAKEDSFSQPEDSTDNVAEQPQQPVQSEQLSEDEEKLRERVRKNVDNEISQIVDKVDAEMLHEALAESGDDFDEDDLTPLITPMPEEEPEVYEYAPVFMAPKAAPKPKRQKTEDVDEAVESDEDAAPSNQQRGRRRGSRGTSRGRGAEGRSGDSRGAELIDEPKAIKGSTRIEAQRRRRAELREKGRERQHIVSQAEFLARRESVERTMVVRDKQRTDGAGIITQVGVLEDDLLVEHFVTTESHPSQIGNIYLGRVQNVLPSMEAAFVDIGQGRNGVLYAGDVDWRALGIGGRGRKIENALKSGDQILVQVAKDPIGHKGARLTTQISLAGRFLVYVPGGRSAGISRKLPAPERKRLKGILERVIPGDGGAIIRTAAENVPEEDIATDVNRLHSLWEDISARAAHEKATKGAKPVTMYEEPDLLIKVVRDLFNEDFSTLVVDGKRSYNTVSAYVDSMAHDLADRVVRYDAREHDGEDAFSTYRIDEQLHKALSRKVWLPSGGTLIIERTEAMTVIDVNTGKFTGSGGNLEETVTRNNLEAAEEIVRQMRLRDMGGMIVVDFIDMVLPENQDLVLRRLKEALGRDRTRHQVSEVTSLGLVQMTRKRVGTGLIETFSTECEACNGRGIIIHEYPVDEEPDEDSKPQRRGRKEHRAPHRDPKQHPAAVRMHRHDDEENTAGVDADDVDAVEDKDSALEDLVANVVVVDSDDEASGRDNRDGRDGDDEVDAGTPDSASIGYAVAESMEPKKSKRSRKPRRATRTSRTSEKKAEVQSPSHEKQSKQRSRQTYEEAVEEFEKSPRRKRRTRGNSRSDVRPKREDFEHEPQASKAADEQGSSAATAQESAKPQESGDGDVTTARSSRGRGRRRAVRRSMKSQQPVVIEEASRASKSRQRDETSAREKEGGAKGASASRKVGRGRRRVTRRSSR